MQNKVIEASQEVFANPEIAVRVLGCLDVFGNGDIFEFGCFFISNSSSSLLFVNGSMKKGGRISVRSVD